MAGPSLWAPQLGASLSGAALPAVGWTLAPKWPRPPAYRPMLSSRSFFELYPAMVSGEPRIMASAASFPCGFVEPGRWCVAVLGGISSLRQAFHKALRSWGCCRFCADPSLLKVLSENLQVIPGPAFQTSPLRTAATSSRPVSTRFPSTGGSAPTCTRGEPPPFRPGSGSLAQPLIPPPPGSAD